MIIGITGKSGSGKNYFAENLMRLNENIVHIDIDLIGHNVFEIYEIKQNIIKCFGDNILTNNKIDRKKLADIVFNSRHEHQKLSDITWDYMQKEIDEIISDKSNDYILNWILLPHTKYFKMCDVKYLIERNDEDRVNAILKRDKISIDKIQERDNNSIAYNHNDFNFVINNIRRK